MTSAMNQTHRIDKLLDIRPFALGLAVVRDYTHAYAAPVGAEYLFGNLHKQHTRPKS
jgi:hypothetical protein